MQTKMNGFGAQFLRSMATFAVARVHGRARGLGIATRWYCNHGCVTWEGWGCYFTVRFVVTKRRSSECTELAKWIPRVHGAFYTPRCLALSTAGSIARAAVVLRSVSGYVGFLKVTSGRNLGLKRRNAGGRGRIT